MNKEQKDLLLKDLCARLPYRIKFPITVKNPITLEPIETIGTISSINEYGIVSFDWDYEGQEILVKDSLHIKDVKPYLFPLSSMTGVEVLEYISLKESIVASDDITYSFETYESIDLLNKNMFDYRGLIPMGLANDATGLNIY